MEKPAFTKANLSNVRDITVIMCVPVEELPCQGVTGWIPVLKSTFVRCSWAPLATSCHLRP
jgi:hypothetical protein